MSKLKDLTNQPFGHLTAIRIDKNPNNKRTKWICRCECGNYCVVASCDLLNGHTQSCGCKRFESRNKIHGLAKTPLYGVWTSMKERCNCKNSVSYKYYGAQGITVCEEWKNDYLSFHNWAIASGYSEGLTIERINVNGNYCPENCKWIPLKMQSQNRNNTVYITDNKGITKSLFEWCTILNLSYRATYNRYRKAKISNNPIKFDDIFAPIPKIENRKNQKICQYNTGGELIKIWNGTKEIRKSGIYNARAVLNCCYGRSQTHKNYCWHFLG